MSKRSQLVLGLVVLVSSTLSFFMLTRGHDWGDDFAGYLLQSKSILSWTMADFITHNTFTVQSSAHPPGPVAYPWGFPLLLAPIYAAFGLHPLALKLVGIAFYAVFLVFFYLLARTRLSENESLLLTGFLSVSPALLAANDMILSDIPFLAFSTLSLYLLDRFPLRKGWAGIALGAAIFMAFFIRTNGILLLAPVLVSLLAAFWPNWQTVLKKTVVPVLTFAILVLIQAIIFPNGQESYLSHFSMFTPARLLDNALYYLRLAGFTFDQLPGGALLYPFLAVFLLISMFARLRRDAALHAYSLLTVMLFILWPERQGLRFIYPVLPFFFISACDGMNLCVEFLKQTCQPFARRIILVFWSYVLFVSLSVSAVSAWQVTSGGRAINGPFDQYSNQLYSFIREETPADSVIIFAKPRALRLFTERDSFMTDRCEQLIEGDYVALHEKMGSNGQIAPEEILACNSSLTLQKVFNNKRFTVFKIQKTSFLQ